VSTERKGNKRHEEVRSDFRRFLNRRNLGRCYRTLDSRNSSRHRVELLEFST
jgi:hypothetical protein